MWFVPLVLLVVAGVLFALPRGVSIPIPESVNVSLDQIKPGAVRTPMGDPPTARIGTFDMQCNSCHKLFESADPTPEVLNQHIDLVHDHGLNSRCFNCHDNKDREKLVARDGSTFPLTDVVTLCAQCHGPTYRDWTEGIHGKTMGSWDPSSAKQERLRCDACHDPHAPAFGPWPLLAGPHTLRAPPPDPDEHHPSSPRPSPLQRWLNHDTTGDTTGDTAAEHADEGARDGSSDKNAPDASEKENH